MKRIICMMIIFAIVNTDSVNAETTFIDTLVPSSGIFIRMCGTCDGAVAFTGSGVSIGGSDVDMCSYYDEQQHQISGYYFNKSGSCGMGDCEYFYITEITNVDNNEYDYELNCTLNPDPAVLVSPSGYVDTARPILTWYAVDCAQWYRVYIWNSEHAIQLSKWYQAMEITSGSTCSLALPKIGLKQGSYEWYVQTWSNAGYGPWSIGMSFTINTNEAQADQYAPSTTITSTTPTFRWAKVAGATYYRLWIGTENLLSVYSHWYQGSEVDNGTECTLTLNGSNALASEDYVWYVQTYNEYGLGPWSRGEFFTVSE